MTRARFVAAAQREFLAEIAYYNHVGAGLGARFSGAVEEATARALAFPLAGSPASRNTRRVLVKDFPFSVVYKPAASGITVFAVAHYSRGPSYWAFRVQDQERVGNLVLSAYGPSGASQLAGATSSSEL